MVLGFALPMVILGHAGCTTKHLCWRKLCHVWSKMLLIRLLCYPSKEKRPQGKNRDLQRVQCNFSAEQVGYLRVSAVLLCLYYRCNLSLSQRQGPAMATAAGRCAGLKDELPDKDDIW